MDLATHAVQRCSQRGIRKQQIEWLITFGCHTWNRGAKVYFFDRSHFQRLLNAVCGRDRQLAEKVRNCYAVIGGQQVITGAPWSGFLYQQARPSRPASLRLAARRDTGCLTFG